MPTYAAKFLQLAPALPVVGKFFERAGPLYFSAVRNQIVCIDDLERRGEGLNLKDVFGLISFLREQRACKIALLLNVEALEQDRTTFDILFEKVIDAQLIFAPTAEEATEIALGGKDEVSGLIRKNCISLGISNIRVIKKIERLLRQIVPLFADLEAELTQQAVHSITLFGWSKFQPSLAPPLEFYRVSSIARYLEHRHGKELTSDEQKWSDILDRYQFSNMDEFDRELVRFVDFGVLDSAIISKAAVEQSEKLARLKKANTLEDSWKPLHVSFDDNLGEVTRSVVDGMKASLGVVSLSQLDSALGVLKELDQQSAADEVTAFYVANAPLSFWT